MEILAKTKAPCRFSASVCVLGTGGVFKFKGHKYMNYFEMFIECL